MLTICRFQNATLQPRGMAELHSRIRNGYRPELPTTCPDYLKFCITQCWQPRPQDRPSSTHLWKLIRFAQVRSLGIIQNDHNLFTFTTREGRGQSLHKLSAPDKDPSKSSSFWLLFWRITLLFARSKSRIPWFSSSMSNNRSRSCFLVVRGNFHGFEKLPMEVSKRRGKVELGFVLYVAIKLCTFLGNLQHEQL